MVKVLLVGNNLDVKGGISSVINQILKHDWISDGVNLRFVPTYNGGHLLYKLFYFAKSYFKIKRILKRKETDVCHIHMAYGGSFYRKYFIHRLCIKYGIKDIIHLHGSTFKDWYLASRKKVKKQVTSLISNCSAFLVLGEKWRAFIESISNRAKVIVLPNSVSNQKEKVSFSPEMKYLYLGVLIKRKGLDDLIDSLIELKNTQQIYNKTFIIAGTGNQEQLLRKRVVANNLSNYVVFTGWVDGERKKDLLKHSQVLILPSYNEGLPVAILEAMSFGMPIISTNVGDIESAVENNVNGFIFNPGDKQKMIEAIVRISEKATFIKFSKKSKELFCSNFSEDVFFENLGKLYLEFDITNE